MIKSKIFYSLCIAALGLSFAEAMGERHVVKSPNKSKTYSRPHELRNRVVPKWGNVDNCRLEWNNESLDEDHSEKKPKGPNANIKKNGNSKRQTYRSMIPVTLKERDFDEALKFGDLTEVDILYTRNENEYHFKMRLEEVQAAFYLRIKECVEIKYIAKILNIAYETNRNMFTMFGSSILKDVSYSYISVNDIEDSIKDSEGKRWYEGFIQKLKNNTEKAKKLGVSGLVDKIINGLGWDNDSEKFRTGYFTHEQTSVATYLVAMDVVYSKVQEALKELHDKKIATSTLGEYKNSVPEEFEGVRYFYNITEYINLSEKEKGIIKKYANAEKRKKELAVRLLWCIRMKRDMLGKYNREDLKKELYALGGVFDKNKGTDDNSLEKQLNEFLGGNTYENWPKNDYDEPVVGTKSGYSKVSNGESEVLGYLIYVGGNEGEIIKTFENVFWRVIGPASISNKRKQANKGTAVCKKSFDEIADDPKLTDLQKERLLEYICGYEINKQKLVVFLTKAGEYSDDDILFIFNKLYNKDYTEEEIKNLKNEGVDSLGDLPPATLAKELYDLGFCQKFVKCGVAAEQCERFKAFLKTYKVEEQEENNGVSEMEIEQDNRVILPSLDSLLKTIESNNNMNNIQNNINDYGIRMKLAQEDNNAVDRMEIEQETAINSQSFWPLQTTENGNNYKSIVGDSGDSETE